MHARPSEINIFWLIIAAVANAVMLDCPDNRGAGSHVRIKDAIAFVCHRQHEPFDKFNRKLARMNGLFDMIVLYVWKYPNIARIFSKWVARKLTDFWSLEIFLVRVFRWNPNGIKIESV